MNARRTATLPPPLPRALHAPIPIAFDDGDVTLPRAPANPPRVASVRPSPPPPPPVRAVPVAPARVAHDAESRIHVVPPPRSRWRLFVLGAAFGALAASGAHRWGHDVVVALQRAPERTAVAATTAPAQADPQPPDPANTTVRPEDLPKTTVRVEDLPLARGRVR